MYVCLCLSAVAADVLGAGDVAFLVYLFNPFTTAVCVGGSTSSIENMLIILCLYGAASGPNLFFGCSAFIEALLIDLDHV